MRNEFPKRLEACNAPYRGRTQIYGAGGPHIPYAECGSPELAAELVRRWNEHERLSNEVERLEKKLKEIWTP